MSDHDRFLALAASAISDALAPRDAFELDEHLASCASCRDVESELVGDQIGLRLLVAARPVAPRVRAAVLQGARDRRSPGAWRLALVAALLALALVGLILAGIGSRRPLIREEFIGSWNATNCATGGPLGQGAHCERWGDGAVLVLAVSPGGAWSISTAGIDDACLGTASDDGTASPPAPGAGVFLLARPTSIACAQYALTTDGDFAIYWDRSGDTLWIDDDGDEWGLQWVRSDG